MYTLERKADVQYIDRWKGWVVEGKEKGKAVAAIELWWRWKWEEQAVKSVDGTKDGASHLVVWR